MGTFALKATLNSAIFWSVVKHSGYIPTLFDVSLWTDTSSPDASFVVSLSNREEQSQRVRIARFASGGSSDQDATDIEDNPI